MGVAIELVDFTKRYGTFESVKQLSLRVEPGEFLTLLGPSGSGKTTTLSAIAGFLSPSSGEILIDGQPVTGLPPERRDIGIVFQHYALFPHMTVTDNVAFPLEMRSMPRRRIAQMVGEALESVQMTPFAHRFPSQLSGGQQQRIALARAMVFRPPVLLLDEPLGALDKKLRESMQIELKRLHERTDVTMIYVTHDQDEALLLSDRIAVMNDGRLEQIGRPEEIYERPRSRFVADFIGESNFLDATLVERKCGQAILRTTGGVECVTDDCHSAPVGTSVSVMIRPERVVIGRDAEECKNKYSGLISERFFAGGTVKYRVNLSTTDSVVAMVKRTKRHLPDIVGQEVTVGWPDDVMVYDNTEGRKSRALN